MACKWGQVSILLCIDPFTSFLAFLNKGIFDSRLNYNIRYLPSAQPLHVNDTRRFSWNMRRRLNEERLWEPQVKKQSILPSVITNDIKIPYIWIFFRVISSTRNLLPKSCQLNFVIIRQLYYLLFCKQKRTLTAWSRRSIAANWDFHHFNHFHVLRSRWLVKATLAQSWSGQEYTCECCLVVKYKILRTYSIQLNLCKEDLDNLVLNK